MKRDFLRGVGARPRSPTRIIVQKEIPAFSNADYPHQAETLIAELGTAICLVLLDAFGDEPQAAAVLVDNSTLLSIRGARNNGAATA